MRWCLVVLVLFISIFSFFGIDKIKDIDILSEEWIDATGKDGKGLYWDIMRAVYEPEGVKVNYKNLSYEGAVKMLGQKKTDAILGSYNDEIDNAVYPKYHFGVDVVKALFKKSSDHKIITQDDLFNKNIGWIKGYEYDSYLSVKVKKFEYTEREFALKALLNNRIDAFIDAEEDILELINEQSLNMSEFELVTIIELNLFVAFADTSKGRSLRDMFDRRLEVLIKSGELKKIFKKWEKSGFKYPY